MRAALGGAVLLLVHAMSETGNPGVRFPRRQREYRRFLTGREPTRESQEGQGDTVPLESTKVER